MKKRIIIGIILLIISLILIIVPKEKFTVDMSIVGNSNVKVGDTITYKITLNETIVACNFNIEYDNNILEFVESETTNLTAIVNDNVVSCMYLDISEQGTTELKIKFKAISENTEDATLGIADVKFRAKDKDTSYVEEDIKGAKEKLNIATSIQNNEENTTTSTNSLSTTKILKIAGYVLMVCSIIVIISGIMKGRKKV